MAVGALFLIVGILGFIPGITTNYDSMQFAGHDSGAKLFGIFQVSILHNIVHLAFGVLGLTLGRSPGTAKGFLVGGGIVYLLFWIYGLIVNKSHEANFVPFNRADDWLHFVLGAGMIALGLALARKVGSRSAVGGAHSRGDLPPGSTAPRGGQEPRGTRGTRGPRDTR